MHLNWMTWFGPLQGFRPVEQALHLPDRVFLPHAADQSALSAGAAFSVANQVFSPRQPPFGGDGASLAVQAQVFRRVVRGLTGVLTTDGSTSAGSLDINGLAAADPALGDELPIYDVSATGNRKVTVEKVGGFLNPAVCEFRLSLTSGLAVTTADVTGAGTLRLTPVFNDGTITTATGLVGLYDGTRVKLYRASEVSLALSVTSGTNYDVWLYDDAGTLTLDLTAWTNATTRATALAFNNGFLTRSGDATRRYVGSIRASGSNTTEDSLGKRFVINWHNAQERRLLARPGYSDGNTTSSYTATSTSWARANGGTGSRVEFLTLGGRPVKFNACGFATANTNSNARVGIGFDSTTDCEAMGFAADAPSGSGGHSIPLTKHDLFGYHTADLMVQVDNAASAATYYADELRNGATADPYATYLDGVVWG